MKDFADRRTDFGKSDHPVPAGMRLMEITMSNGETWRVELEPDEIETPELRAALESQAAEFMDFAGIMLRSYT